MELPKKTVCLAIPTYNREEILINTLKSVFALNPKPDEILVIDQTTDHGAETAAFLQAANEKVQIRWIHHGPPSLTGARNRAISETKSEIVIFIDDDVELPKDFVAKHLRNYGNDQIQAVAGGVRQENPPHYPPLPRNGKWPRVLDYKYFSVYDQKRTEGVATFMGCNHSVKVKRLMQLGGYDVNYIGSAFREDTDMAVRILKSGGIIVFDPEAWLHHLVAPTGGCRIPQALKANPEWWVPFNRNYFAWRHLFPSWEFWWMTFFRDFRETVLRKSNFFRPWRIPASILAYGYSTLKAGFEAFKKHREEILGLSTLEKNRPK